MSIKQIHYTKLPKAALNGLSARQRSYIDEFTFYKRTNGEIEGWYAGELLAVWSPREENEFGIVHEAGWRHGRTADSWRYRKGSQRDPKHGAIRSSARHLSHGFYWLTDREAGQLAKSAGKKLPRHGYEIQVPVPGHGVMWLQRTPARYVHHLAPKYNKRGWIWAVY